MTVADDTRFEYRLRESPRARGVRLRVSMEHGLEVVVPRGFNLERVPRLLEQKRRWINAALERARAQRALYGYDAPWALPSVISFPAFGVHWPVRAQATSSTSVRVQQGTDALVLSGAVDDEAACRAALGRWWLRAADEHLRPRLMQVSERTGLYHRGLSVRRQRSRWGSCSPQGAINLNAKLMFQPTALVEYVMIHELCHLREMNHSARFWALVERHDPDYKVNDRALNDAWKRVPIWAR
jgi:predicted metal-dependent hydrolase